MWTAYWDSFVKVQLVVVHGLGVLNAIHAAFKVRQPQAAIGWALGLVTFPYFAIPLYWTFGRAKFIGYRCAMTDQSGPLHQAAEQAEVATAPYVVEAATGTLDRWRKLLTTLPVTRGNHVELLIHDDTLGEKFRDRLIQRARAGVKIYFLYDEVGCHKLPRRWFDSLRESGVRVEGFKTTRGRGNRFQLNFRNHRKVVIADGREALTGGLNVGDEYMGHSDRFGPWRDTHVRVRGPAVQAAQLAFIEDWYWATDEVPSLSWIPTAADADQRVLVLATGPADEAELCSLAFIRAVNSAQTRLWISSPYFVPDSTVLTALQLAALRGVEVRVLLPQRIDHLLPMLSSFSYYESLALAGIEVWRYQTGFLHQKALLVDDRLAAVGSVNVDYRSFHLNFELVVMVTDPAFCAQTEAMMKEDFARADRVDLSEYRRRPWWFKTAVRLARLLSPVE
jgi:cardiolipin synthase